MWSIANVSQIPFCKIYSLKTCKKIKWSRYRSDVAQRVGRGIALIFHGRGTRRGWVVSNTPRPNFTPGKDTLPILQEAGWAPGPVWTGGKSRPYRDSIPDRPALVSRYTDWATGPTLWKHVSCIKVVQNYIFVFVNTFYFVPITYWTSALAAERVTSSEIHLCGKLLLKME